MQYCYAIDYLNASFFFCFSICKPSLCFENYVKLVNLSNVFTLITPSAPHKGGISPYLKRHCPPYPHLVYNATGYRHISHKRHAYNLRNAGLFQIRPPPPSSVDVLSDLRPSSLQALPTANPTAPHPLLTPHCPCFSFPFSFFSLFFLLQERCMNITAVRRLSSTLSHLSKNIPKMAYQTRIIGVSF